MTSITTTITEPKTFQQIQDQKNEFGREKALEDLNNNIIKLVEAVNNKFNKTYAQDDRKLKQNQLELSELQLRRAKLGLAKDEKYYSDYSRKWNEKNGIGSSVGIDQNSRNNGSAIAISALTGGAINPVIAKQILLPPLKVMSNIIKGMFNQDRIVSGKTSSAIASSKENKLHNKLDSILSAIKEKTRPTEKTEEKEKSLFSKVISSILGLSSTVGKVVLGMIGSVLLAKLGEKLGPTIEGLVSKVVGRKAAPEVTKWLTDIGPEMIAGYAIAGWKGALVGGGLKLALDSWAALFPKEGELENPPEISATVTALNGYLPDPLKFDDDAHFKATLSGLMLGGLKGMVVGWLAGKYGKDFSKWIGSTPKEQDEAAETDWKLKFAKALGLDDTKAVLPVIGGFMYAGIKGAVVGYAAGQILKMFQDEEKLKDAIVAGDELEKDRLQEELKKDQYRVALSGALAGFQAGGFSGAIIGGMLGLFGSGIAIGYKKYGNLNTSFQEQLDSTYFGIPAEVWIGGFGLAGLALKAGLGLPGILIGLVAGSIGGFIADRLRSKDLIEDMGFESERRGLSYFVKGTDISVENVRQEARQELWEEKVKYERENPGKTYEITEDMVKQRTKEKIESQLGQERAKNEKKQRENLYRNYGSFKQMYNVVGNEEDGFFSGFDDAKKSKIRIRDTAFEEMVKPLKDKYLHWTLTGRKVDRNVVLEDLTQQLKERGVKDENLKKIDLNAVADAIEGGKVDKGKVADTIMLITDPEALEKIDFGEKNEDVIKALLDIKNAIINQKQDVNVTVNNSDGTKQEVKQTVKRDKNGNPIS